MGASWRRFVAARRIIASNHRRPERKQANRALASLLSTIRVPLTRFGFYPIGESTTPDIDAAQMSAFSLTDFPG